MGFSLGFRPEFGQIIEDRGAGESGAAFPFLSAYQGNATFLKTKPYTLKLFGTRDTKPSRSAFASKTETQTDTYGANLNLKYRFLPTSFTYTHRSSLQTGFYDSDQDSDEVRIQMSHQRKNNDTSLNAFYKDEVRATRGVTTHTKSSNNSIRNRYDITEDKRVRLNSSLSSRWTDSDALTTSGIRLSENLYWEHRKNLRTNYRLNYNTDSSGDFDTQTISFIPNLTHLLYENLTTSVSGEASYNDFTGGSMGVLGGDIDFDYSRKIPWGILNIFTGYDYRVTDRSLTEEFIQVIDESHILRTGDVTVLDNEHVVTDSIRVSNSTGSIVYIQNIDYTVQEVGAFVRISRTPFGSIANGRIVLVSYQYISNPAFDDAVFGQKYGIGIDLWDALSLSFRYRHLNQNVLSGIPPNNPVDDTTYATEAKFRWRWTDTRLSYEDADINSGISTRRWLAEENILFMLGSDFFFRLSGHYGRTQFKDNGETEEFYGLISNIDRAITRWCRLSIEGFWENVSGVSQKTQDTGFSTILELAYGKWRGNITYRFLYENDEIQAERRTKHYVFFEISKKT